MTWGKQAAHSLAETLGSWFTTDGVAAAAARPADGDPAHRRSRRVHPRAGLEEDGLHDLAVFSLLDDEL
jgi:hypothetical protein